MAENAKFLTLEAWAATIYGEAAPCMNTLRAWARSGRISPQPEKHGRSYYVRPNAVYAEHDTVSTDFLQRLKDARKHGPKAA